MNWYSSGADLLQVAVATTSLFLYLLILIRLFGSRSIAALTPFDFVIVVAIGNLLAAVAVTPTLPISNAFVAIGLLLGLEWISDQVTSRSKRADRLITGQPRTLAGAIAQRQAPLLPSAQPLDARLEPQRRGAALAPLTPEQPHWTLSSEGLGAARALVVLEQPALGIAGDPGIEAVVARDQQVDVATRRWDRSARALRRLAWFGLYSAHS